MKEIREPFLGLDGKQKTAIYTEEQWAARTKRLTREINDSATLQSPTEPNDQSAAALNRKSEAQSQDKPSAGEGSAAAPLFGSSAYPEQGGENLVLIEKVFLSDLGRDPEWIASPSEEGRKSGIKVINDIVWKLDAVTQNKSLEWKLRMASARISKYLDTVMSQKDHCGLVPLFP